MAGCQYVLHVASPLSDGGDDIVAVASEGTRPCARPRIVPTSSASSSRRRARPPHPTRRSSPASSTSRSGPTQTRSACRRTGARRRSPSEPHGTHVGDHNLSLTTVLPAAVFGPALSPSSLSSLQVIGVLLDGSAIAVPRLGFEVVDVRDVAAAHVLAMTSPAAGGSRFIVTGDLLWFGDIADILREALGSDAARVPTATLTDDEFREIAALSPRCRRCCHCSGATSAIRPNGRSESSAGGRDRRWRPSPTRRGASCRSASSTDPASDDQSTPTACCASCMNWSVVISPDVRATTCPVLSTATKYG